MNIRESKSCLTLHIQIMVVVFSWSKYVIYKSKFWWLHGSQKHSHFKCKCVDSMSPLSQHRHSTTRSVAILPLTASPFYHSQRHHSTTDVVCYDYLFTSLVEIVYTSRKYWYDWCNTQTICRQAIGLTADFGFISGGSHMGATELTPVSEAGLCCLSFCCTPCPARDGTGLGHRRSQTPVGRETSTIATLAINWWC